MKLKKLFTGAVATILTLTTVTMPVNYSSASLLAPMSITASAVSQNKINAADVTLFGLSNWAKDYLTIPDNLPQSFQLAVENEEITSCRIISGDDYIVNVTSDGLLTIKLRQIYQYQYDKDGKYVLMETEDLWCGSCVVRVSTRNNTYDVKVNVSDYADYYANKVMDQYISENIEPNMSTEEKIDKIAKFVADRNYDYHFFSAVEMIVTGGGDCWASTYTIISMAKKVGLDAWARKAYNAQGNGPGHKNAMVTDGEKYYEVEAGYTGTAPRYYSITERTTLFRCRYNSEHDCFELYQYDGKKVPQTFDIPSSVEGQTIECIGEYFLYLNDDVTTINLPSTIKYIDKSAFNSCENLETINIPSSVEEIKTFAFSNCTALKNVNASGSYSFIDGVLYKDNNSVVAVPNVSSATIPSGITDICEYSFYYNSNIKSVTLPDTIKNIGEAAFGDCNILESVNIPDGVQTLNDWTFCNCYKLKSIKIPDSVTSVGNYVFRYCHSLEKVIIPESVKTIGEKVFEGADKVKFYGYKNSYAQTYATENNIAFVPLDFDVSKDDDVNIADALLIAKYDAGLTQFDNIQLKAAEVTGDGEVNIADALMIARYDAGLIDNL
ncbi:MAG: leucine-rich repeat protein [Acutalibacteraceae bacterium]